MKLIGEVTWSWGCQKKKIQQLTATGTFFTGASFLQASCHCLPNVSKGISTRLIQVSKSSEPLLSLCSLLFFFAHCRTLPKKTQGKEGRGRREVTPICSTGTVNQSPLLILPWRLAQFTSLPGYGTSLAKSSNSQRLIFQVPGHWTQMALYPLLFCLGANRSQHGPHRNLVLKPWIPLAENQGRQQ